MLLIRVVYFSIKSDKYTHFRDTRADTSTFFRTNND